MIYYKPSLLIYKYLVFTSMSAVSTGDQLITFTGKTLIFYLCSKYILAVFTAIK